MGEFSEALRQQVLSWLTDHVPQSRIEHVLRVEKMAADLAHLHKLDVSQAAQAGLMHDLAKYFKPHILLQMAQVGNLSLDRIDQINPHLLHADVSAIVAQQEFAVQEAEVLAAIANHTLGTPGMSDLSCVVFLADRLEPGRGDSPELEALRHVSQRHLKQSVWMACDYTLKRLLETGRLIHPRALATRNWFLHQCPSRHRLSSYTGLSSHTGSAGGSTE